MPLSIRRPTVDVTEPAGIRVNYDELAKTNRRGQASFSTSDGHGLYALTINDLELRGFTFDASNSVLSNSITK